MALDANTLQRVFSVVTYPAPCTRQLLDGERPAPGTAVPLALGPRWLAYASNQVSREGFLSQPCRRMCGSSSRCCFMVTKQYSLLHVSSCCRKEPKKLPMSHAQGLTEACMQALSESASPQSLGPTSQRLPSGLKYDSVSGYAKAAALTGGKQLLGLGEAGYKYVSSQYGQWRSGTWEGASTRCGMLPPQPSPVIL